MGSFADFVALEAVAGDRFRSAAEQLPNKPVLFGGGLVAQGLAAAATTVDPDKAPNSLQASFVRAGRSGVDVEFRVARTRDGRAFSTRQVTASQGERVLVTMTASFHLDEPSPEYQQPIDASVPGPEQAGELSAARLRHGFGLEIIEIEQPRPPRYYAWMRNPEPMAADRVLHACMLVVMSDNGAPGVTATSIGQRAGGPDGSGGDGPMTTSLDHTMWFHRSGRLDDWILVSATPLSTSNSRGLMLGTLHDRDGTHLASFVQEMLVRAQPR